jgi:hypothetical protein
MGHNLGPLSLQEYTDHMERSLSLPYHRVLSAALELVDSGEHLAMRHMTCLVRRDYFLSHEKFMSKFKHIRG